MTECIMVYSVRAASRMVKGLRNFEGKVGRVQDQVKRALRGRLAIYADRMVSTAQDLVREDEGNLKNSIHWVWGSKVPPRVAVLGSVKGSDPDLIITIIAGDESTIVTNSRGIEFQNALIQEFGSSHSSAHPYMRPSYARHQKAARSGMRREAKKAWRRALT